MDDALLCKIAEEPVENNSEHPRNFELDGKNWLLSSFLPADVIQIMKIYYRKHSKSKIQFVEIDSTAAKSQLVAICRRTTRPGVNKEQLTLMAELFPIIFKNYSSACELIALENIPADHDNDEDSGKQKQKLMKKYVTTKLYDALYKKHKSVAIAMPALNLPECFRPTLCRYQERTVEWLLQREKQIERFPALYVKLEARDDVSTVYKHMYDVDLQTEEPPSIELAPGGILADEMGLGKTVEMLALILLHPRQMSSIVNPFSKSLDLEDIVLSKRQRRETSVFCICVSKSTRHLEQCSKCLQWQHVRCVSKYNAQHEEAANEPYLCPSCWNELTQVSLLPTRATFIVSPHPIKTQWLSEIQRHIDPTLRVLLYEGVADGRWISPAQLADYDIVLTDYNVLRGEVYHTSDHVSERVCRNKPRSMRVHTPLLMLEWWRVCLDEAQMVESNTSKVAALVRMLPAVNRWAVTGTPIQRSIDDLCPLLQFIGFQEACEPQMVWDNLVHEFMLHQEHEPHLPLMLISLLQKCMWRTCKSQVIDELQIPPQSEVVHHIDLSNLERLFYTEQHGDCESNFNETVDKHIKRSQRVATISPQIMKLILQPLLKIRQCCNTPVVSGSKKNNALMLQKQFLQPKDLLTHLKSANELECKSELRSMASSYNGMAAIYFIRKNYNEAIKHYECVLKLASDYKEMNLSVDSLLQIHALHNIQQAHFTAPKENQHLSDESIEKYEQQCNNLEWKYLETYSSTLKGVQSDFQVAKDALQTIESQTAANLLEFLSQLLQTIVKEQAYLHEPLINKIFDDCRTQFAANAKLAEMHSINGILYTVNVWFGKVTKAQKKLDREFKNLNFFTDNIRSRNQVDSGIWRQMMQFVSSVYDCHLSKIREKPNDNETEMSNRKKPLCKLCLIREVLDGYECLLFDKVIDKSTNQMEGLANPSLEIHIIKIILTFMKSKLKNHRLAQLIEKYAESIELMITLCKKLIKYWIEIEYTVKAYDELDMCRMRISVAENKDEESIYRIGEYEVDDILTEQQFNLHSAQRQFVLKLARLKYIMHLETDADPGACPICHSEDQAKYVVLECGHHICFPCLKSVLEYAKYRNLTCSICRNHQSSKKIYFVTRTSTQLMDGGLEVKGNYSSKIMHIVRLIIKLKREHSNNSQSTPKILIFSQWQPILNAIATALLENGVLHRLYSPRSIEEFKSTELGITCLLMVLAKGSKGLNLIEATHVFLVEPILNPGEELQAIGRVHRFGQTQPTTVHRFIVRNTIEENVFNVVATGRETQANWEFSNMTLESLRNLFQLQNDLTVEYTNGDTRNITGSNLVE